MASRRRPSARSSRDRKTRRKGGGFRFILWTLLLGGMGMAVWYWRPSGPAWQPSARGLRPQPRQPGPQGEPPSAESEPPAPKSLPEPEPPRVRVATNLVRQPQPGLRRTAIETNQVVSPGGSAKTDPTNHVVPTPDRRPPLEGRPVRDPFEAQLALARRGIACGPLDGSMGMQTRAAIQIFQQYEGLPVTGALDLATRETLRLHGETYGWFTVTPADVQGLAPIPSTWLGKSQMDRLGYETILEQVAEFSHSHPALIRKLNPSVDWSRVGVGASIRIPKAEYPPVRSRASLVRISLSQRHLRAFDDDGVLLCFFPCSIAQRVDKRPIGDLRVEVVIKDPDYTFNPEVFPESTEARELKRKLVLKPGPNNPVGVAWIGLSRSGYGIHGTPNPEAVGRTESHGCFRLANWNADYLRQLVSVGTPVTVEP